MIQVNGRDLSQASHQEAVESFRTTEEPIVVEVLRHVNKNKTKTHPTTSNMVSIGTQTEEAIYGYNRPPTPPLSFYPFLYSGMTSTRKSPLLATSKKYKRRKLDRECIVMGSDTESETAIKEEYDSTTHTDVNSIHSMVGLNTLNSDQRLDDFNSVCVKMETNEWYNAAAGLYSMCAKSEQVLQEEIQQKSNKQDSFNLEQYCDKSIKKEVLTNQSIGFTIFKLADIDVKSEAVNSNLVENSGKCASDDFEELFIERNKRKSKSYHSTLPSPKRVPGQGSSRGEVKPRVTENAAKRTVPHFLKPAKRKLNEKGDLVSVKRVKEVKTPEKDKIQNSFGESNLASCIILEPPDDDNLLYCGECNKEFEGDCPVHGPYNYVRDKEMPEGDPHRADHTLPDDLEIKTSKIIGAGLGVFSKVGLDSRIMFGPYGGDIITDNSKSGYCWQIYKDGKASNFVDAQDKATSNWMRYVNCAMTEADQNLVAFQYKGGIHYCTFKPVSPEEELLVWYGDEYARELGIIRDKNLLFRPKYVNGEEIFQCVYCKTAFSSAVPCARHLRKMHGGDKLTSNDMQVLDQWLRENDQTYLKKYSKHLNLTTINTKLHSSSKVKHNKSHISQSACEKQLKCAILQKKNIENTDEKEYNREVSNYTSNNRSHMKTHMRLQTGEGLYKCEVCGYECYHTGNLKTHMRIHIGEKPYKCEVCSYECNNYGNLKTHMRKHTGEKPYKCEVCNYECNNYGNLKTHMRKHTGEKPYKCEVCSYECSRSGMLKTHRRIHTEEKPYKCELCGCECKRMDSLKRHMRIHTGERLNKCEMCGYECHQSGDLKSHMRIHTGEKPYKCVVCSYECNQSGTLKRHMRIHTRVGLHKSVP
ncbi:histone-lysine N-methyltransferase PRDM9-like isoform X2 [Dreissena polymorpha]|uniref:histone-lysine N-methyltransferase PRDM9-like isoform X2 n=1 Tax=Dreissena polymorpha TaxID=45954 RepID=UPI0022651002|nr:histone-lysine N-methyltransferase PRDM9-like isoform X2 [Dreissena polymorpha]